MLGIVGFDSSRFKNMYGFFAVLVPTVRFLVRWGASLLERMVGVVCLIVVVSLVAHSIEALSLGSSIEYLSSTPMQSLAYMSLFLNQVIGSVGFILLAKEESDRELKRAASHDSLTNLLNRRAFHDRARAALAQCARRKESIAFVTMDLDHFKEIKDRYGHDMGDEALKLFAGSAASVLRPYDILARFGGEEFALLLPCVSRETAFDIASRLRELVESVRLPQLASAVSFTVSIGLVVRPAEEAGSLDDLYWAADLALYQAKEEGRNRVVEGVATGIFCCNNSNGLATLC